MRIQASLEQKLNILIVDDDAECQRLLAQMLQLLGFHSIELAHGCAEALRCVDTREFDLIFCELQMSERDGVETMRLLSERNVPAQMVIMSAADPRLLQAAQRLANRRGLDVVGTLRKPLAPRAVEKLLARSRVVSAPASRLHRQLNITEDELEAAIADDQLVLHYQPQISLVNGVHVGAEALVRWRHPTLGLLYPDAFIPLAESCALIDPLTEWVVNAAMVQVRHWCDVGLPCQVAVNLSALNLKSLDLPDKLAARVEQLGLRPESLLLEITETGTANNVEALLDITTRLRLKGFALAIDDFGTGYANLTQLRQLPFTELKLDRSFIRGANPNNEAGCVVKSSVELAQRLGLNTVAEGIENLFDWQFLMRLGVDRGQGYFIAKPMPASELGAWRKQWDSQHAVWRRLPDSLPAMSC